MLSDLEAKAAAGEAFSQSEAERVLACTDLVSVGTLGELARRARHGDVVTFAQVMIIEGAGDNDVPSEMGGATEVRIITKPASVDEACAQVRTVTAVAGGRTVTGYSVADLLELAGGDHLKLAEVAGHLRDAGLAGVAFLPVDRFEEPAELVRALMQGGLLVSRATIEHAATAAERLACIMRVASLQDETSALQAFAPLPRVDDPESPSTGYDDVRTIAVARLVCANVPSIQVDWALYGPKLAQVAIAYGADDIDNVAAIDTLGLGHRRSPATDIARQITAAFATPAERNARFERRVPRAFGSEAS
jgi:aminodeoxyfutalosine synthase